MDTPALDLFKISKQLAKHETTHWKKLKGAWKRRGKWFKKKNEFRTNIHISFSCQNRHAAKKLGRTVGRVKVMLIEHLTNNAFGIRVQRNVWRGKRGHGGMK